MAYLDLTWDTVDTDLAALAEDVKTPIPDDTDGRVQEIRDVEAAVLAATQDRPTLDAQQANKIVGLGFGPVSEKARGFYLLAGPIGERVAWTAGTQVQILTLHAAIPSLLGQIRAAARGEKFAADVVIAMPVVSLLR